jgi:hypothetical protein
MNCTVPGVSHKSPLAFNRVMIDLANERGSMTRRRWGSHFSAGLALFAVKDLFGASDFWNKKSPAAWTSDEILQLATNSPWARTARVLPNPGRDKGSFDSTVPDLSGGNSGGRSGNKKLGEVPVLPVAEVTVVWESARPLLDALKTVFPSDFENHYVIGVNDLPATEGGRKVNQESMSASLQAHGKDAVDAGGVLPTRNVVLFAFSKELLPLSVADKEVLFSLETNQYSIKTRFNLKEMTYRGRLAV